MGLPEPLRELLQHLTWGNRRGVVLTAATALGVSGLLAVVVGVLASHEEMTLRNTITLIGWFWAGTFGANFTVDGEVLEVSASASAGVWPLGLTIATGAATLWMWLRTTRGPSTVRTMLVDAVRVAVVVAFGVALVAALTRSGVDVMAYGDTAEEYAGLGMSPDVSLGASAAGAFGSAVLGVAVLLALAAAARPDLFTGRAQRISATLRATLRGTAVLVLALPVVGVIVASAVWLVGDGSRGGDLSVREWVEIVTLVLAFSGNLGVFGLSLGASGDLGVSGRVPGVGSSSYSEGLRFFTSEPVDEWGLWISVVLTPLVLAACVYAVGRRSSDREDARRSIACWVLSLLVVLPTLGRFANINARVEVDGIGGALDGAAGLFSFLSPIDDLSGLVGDELNGVGSAGVSLVGTTFLLTGYALLIALAVALASGLLSPAELAAAGRSAGRRLKAMDADTAAPAGAAPAAPPVYQVGDVVNGYRFDGHRWLPYEHQNPGTPPPPPPPPGS